MDNRIHNFAAPPSPQEQQQQQQQPFGFGDEVSPEASAVGENIMDEFIMYLTLKGKIHPQPTLKNTLWTHLSFKANYKSCHSSDIFF
jgi:hypothetical protein